MSLTAPEIAGDGLERQTEGPHVEIHQSEAPAFPFQAHHLRRPNPLHGKLFPRECYGKLADGAHASYIIYWIEDLERIRQRKFLGKGPGQSCVHLLKQDDIGINFPDDGN